MTVQVLGNRGRRAFTLIELLLVVGIITLLAGLIIPSVYRAQRLAERARATADLSAVETALEAYKADHGDYPRVLGTPDAAKGGYDGAIALCQALVAPAALDNKDAAVTTATPGFRTRAGGKVYGPYLPADTFKMAAQGTPTDPANPESFFAFLDISEKPILYYPASLAKPNLRLVSATAPPYVGNTSDTTSLYDQRDNTVLSLEQLRAMLGDQNTPNGNGAIDGGETPVEKNFLLWSAGPDAKYGPDFAGVTVDEAVRQCDDATNFR